MFRRTVVAIAVLFLAIAGSIVTAGTSQAQIVKGGQYGSAHACYNAINNDATLKAHRSFCELRLPLPGWQIAQWEIGDHAIYYGGEYGRLDGCYNGIYQDVYSEQNRAFCNFGSDRVYHIYFAI
jgi:hypothetical protein